MSQSTHNAAARKHPSIAIRTPRAASTFAALGDPTRLSLLAKLSRKQRQSISKLAHDSHLTRQAITKHLRVLEAAGLARSRRRGRERLWQLERQRLQEARRYLDSISRQWDEALARLRDLVEK